VNTHAFKVVIAGGGFAGLETMVALRSFAEERVAIDLLAPEPDFRYVPLAVAAPFGSSQPQRFPLEALAERCGARYVAAALASVEAHRFQARTTQGESLEYDALVVACGARAQETVPGALTFRGPRDVGRVRDLLARIEAGTVERVAFAVPAGVSWPVPLYELALMTARRARQAATATRITLVTPEKAPLAVFGVEASHVVQELLEEAGVRVATERHAVRFAGGTLELLAGDGLAADAVVSLPLLRGPYLPGLPHDADGFLRVDDHWRVEGVTGVYAAGDVTAFPVKQGGLAAQQAEAVASAIASDAGAPVEAEPLDPVLRGLLLTGERPAFLRAALGGHGGDPGAVGWEPLWWPATKVAARHLTPFLAEYVRGGRRPAAPL
jgi:sulfide:quinone oxidoreductase